MNVVISRYDSVIRNGQVKHQRELNDNNALFVSPSTSFFLDYKVRVAIIRKLESSRSLITASVDAYEPETYRGLSG